MYSQGQTVMLVFIGEALMIVLSSVMLGTIVGISQSIAITLQTQILTENVFSFEFPWGLYIALVIASILTAIISSIIPSWDLIKTSPALLLRA